MCLEVRAWPRGRRSPARGRSPTAPRYSVDMEMRDPQPDDRQSEFESDLDLADRTLTQEELEDLTESEQSPADVTYSSQDFDVAGLVRRLQSGAMLIPRLGLIDDRIDTEGFQRGFVWSRAQMDRFIESLL